MTRGPPKGPLGYLRLKHRELTAYKMGAIQRGSAARFIHLATSTGRWWLRSVTHLARVHNLNPSVFIGLSLAGMIVQALYYLPWFKDQSPELAFFVLLRILSLAAPFYILTKGKRIAAVFNASLIAGWALNTTWHVCYFFYL